MESIFEYRHRVAESEVDGLGHANNAAYLVWMQDAAVAHSRSVGLGEAEYERMGTSWVVRRHEIEYLRPVFAGESIVVDTWVQTLEKVTSCRRYEIRREEDDELLARAATQWVFVDRRRGRPVRILTEVRRLFQVEPRETLDRVNAGRQSRRSSAPGKAENQRE